MENIYLFSGIPRSIPRIDPYGRKPVGKLPHARGYRNGFLGEAKDAGQVGQLCFMLSSPYLFYKMVKLIKKPTLSQAFMSSFMLKLSYRTAATFGVFAGLSLAGFEYRRFDLERKPGRTQEDEDPRKEKNSCILSAIGAASGIPLAWALRHPQQALGPKIRLPRLSFSRCLVFGLGHVCLFAWGLNGMYYGMYRSFEDDGYKVANTLKRREAASNKLVISKRYDDL